MYQAFYKLQGKPFQLTPDPAMLFPSKGHKRAMAYLLYGLEQGEGFVMITGAVGTGKTLLIQKLFEELAHRNIAMASIASANLDGEDILPAVASAFELTYEGRSKEALLQDVKQHLIKLRDRHSRMRCWWWTRRKRLPRRHWRCCASCPISKSRVTRCCRFS